MKPFVFKLETLLEIRRRKEEEASILLSQARNRLNEAKQVLTKLCTQQKELWSEFRSKQEAGELVVLEYQMWHRFFAFLKKEIENQQLVVEGLTKEAVAALKELEIALKNRKAVEKLKERRLEEYRLAVQAEEQKILDEIAITRYQRPEGDEL